jgi:hypothetical protein
MFTWIVLYAGEGVSLLILLENLHLSCFSIIQSVCTEASGQWLLGFSSLYFGFKFQRACLSLSWCFIYQLGL